jgi:putative chitinase
MALDSMIATRILFRGCAEGWFTGRKLGQYFNDSTDDPINARQIVNGNDCDELIAGYYETFLEALREAEVH